MQVYEGQETVYKFIDKTVEETTYCKNIKKNYFKKELVMTNKIIRTLKSWHMSNI